MSFAEWVPFAERRLSLAEPGRGGLSDFATFTSVAVDPEQCAETADALADAWRRDLADVPGLVHARVHVALDRSAIVLHSRWDTELSHAAAADRRAAADAVTTRRVVGPVEVFAGQSADHIAGPQVGRTPGVVAVATRHFDSPAAADAVLRLFYRSSAWKRGFPGFISATPFLRSDALEFVNYPEWVDRAAYDAWMADPRISDGQVEIARFESAPPRYLVCEVIDVLSAPAETSPGAADVT